DEAAGGVGDVEASAAGRVTVAAGRWTVAATLRVGVGFGGGSGVVSGGSSAWGCCGDGGGVVVDGSRVTAASEGE
nr:hypothetical protein [Tanacetum cinerariifolium]